MSASKKFKAAPPEDYRRRGRVLMSCSPNVLTYGFILSHIQLGRDYLFDLILASAIQDRMLSPLDHAMLHSRRIGTLASTFYDPNVQLRHDGEARQNTNPIGRLMREEGVWRDARTRLIG